MPFCPAQSGVMVVAPRRSTSKQLIGTTTMKNEGQRRDRRTPEPQPKPNTKKTNGREAKLTSWPMVEVFSPRLPRPPNRPRPGPQSRPRYPPRHLRLYEAQVPLLFPGLWQKAVERSLAVASFAGLAVQQQGQRRKVVLRLARSRSRVDRPRPCGRCGGPANTERVNQRGTSTKV